MELRDLQLQELDILRECLKIINKYNLRYYMLGGTFLGAIRHKGFIPWDDDIDIGMPRPDYESFIKVAQKELPDFLKLVSYKNDSDYKKYFIKILNKNVKFVREDTIKQEETNLWIDIFPLDGMPNNILVRKLHSYRLLFRRLQFQYSVFEKGVNIRKKRPLHEMLLIKLGYVYTRIFHLNVDKQLNKLDHLLMKYRYDESKFVVNFMGAYKFKEMFPKEYYANPVEYDFEDMKLYGASEYDKILTQMYGEYMKPPAQNQRFSHSIRMEIDINGE